MLFEEIGELLKIVALIVNAFGQLALVELIARSICFGIALVDYYIVLFNAEMVFKIII